MLGSITERQYGILAVCMFVILGAFAQGCTQAVNEKTIQPAQQLQYPSEVKTKQLKPGLSVIYFHDKYLHIKEMPTGKRIVKYAHPGPPILKIDHRFGRGEVFDSGRSQAVGMIMSGYFHLEEPGVYQFQAHSNDGFQLYINNSLVINDPGVHPDRLSDPGRIEVVKEGWYPVELKYFQRKGTAILELYWQTPGSDAFTIIPERVYAHQPE